MSLYYYTFKCPSCAHTEKQHEGALLFGEYIYEMVHCRHCGKVISAKLTAEQERAHDYPLCCGEPMKVWDKKCPQCGTLMTITSSYSDVI